MTITCVETAERYLATISAAFTCSVIGERLRVVTPYPYPDNDLIELFVEELSDSTVRVTDLGETMRHLYASGMDISASRKRREMVETILEGSSVNFDRGQLAKEGPASRVGDLMFDVIVAARGVSDLVLTLRSYEPATFKEEFGGLLEKQHIAYESNVRIEGVTGKKYTIDFRLPKTNRYLLILSPSQPNGMQTTINRVFRVWADIDGQIDTRSKLSLFNDLDYHWQDPDVALLKRASTVLYWTHQDEIFDKLLGE
jgi:hypothetical protein